MRFISATQIFDGSKFLASNSVLVLEKNNALLNIVKQEEAPSGQVEKLDGIICPGFVNAHCHLELSHMKGAVPEKTGFVNFAKGIMTKRFGFTPEKIQEEIVKADEFMWQDGIVAVGDICNVPDTFKYKSESKIFYHSFVELLGLNPILADLSFAKGKEVGFEAEKSNLSWSLVPHAPYSVSLQLMKMLSEFNAGHKDISSIHNQESKAENDFFEKNESEFYELYKSLNLDISYFKPSGKSSLQTYLSSLIANKKLILVHNTFSSAEDIDFAQKLHSGLYWCLCPNANLYIENSLPDVKLLMEKGLKICLGTDSLTSNHTLSIIDEMNVLLKNFSFIQPETVLNWATKNGAEALDLQKNFGALVVGKNSGLNLLSYEDREFRLSQKLA
jgi:aminodeoxyfutalosine deaminase